MTTGAKLFAAARGAASRWLPPAVKWRLRAAQRALERWRARLLDRRQPRLLPPTAEYDLVVLPIIDWAFRFQRPQQLASQLAHRGHRVFYLRTTFGSGSRATVRRVAENVAVVELPGPSRFDLYRQPLPEDEVPGLLAALAALRADFRLEQAVCWVQFPSWRPLAEAARERWGWRLVYDCMDHHAGFAGSGAAIDEEEARLVASSDLVVVTSRGLAAKWRQAARRLLVLPNATDFEHFRHPAPRAAALAGIGGPIVGYYGAIAEWFDVELVAAVAAARPQWQVVLGGSTVGADVAPLRALPNVHLLGELPYRELPGYLHAFDVALIPFARTPLTAATNPVKLYEYLSAGKPVVAVELPELEPFAELIYPVRSSAEMVPQVEAALAERSPELRQARIELASRNTWERRAAELRQAVAAIHPRVAIVVVAFAEVERLRLCLESVFAQTQHPNFTVVVVDNSTAPALRQMLAAIAAREPRLQVVCNDRNEGFPRANNIGIAAAGPCDYVVLLNDDTVVTRGWLPRLLRHLDRPGVELVGPVTNWAGNEARIEVSYRTLEEMPAFADAYTRRHEGVLRDLPMLAMFCVAMRRSLLERIGMLDERFGIGMFEDDDFARRVRSAGGRVVCAEDVFVHHWGRSSFGALPDDTYRRLFEENRRHFEAKWGEPWRPHQARGAAPG